MAMDDVAFDFMDAMAPGCTAMFPFNESVSYINQRMTECITGKYVGGTTQKHMIHFATTCDQRPDRTLSPQKELRYFGICYIPGITYHCYRTM